MQFSHTTVHQQLLLIQTQDGGALGIIYTKLDEAIMDAKAYAGGGETTLIPDLLGINPTSRLVLMHTQYSDSRATYPAEFQVHQHE